MRNLDINIYGYLDIVKHFFCNFVTDPNRTKTVFETNKATLRAFQSWLKARDMTMAPVLEHWITQFMAAPEEERRAYVAGTISKDNPSNALEIPPKLPAKDFETKPQPEVPQRALYRVGPRSPQERECRNGLQEIFDSADPDVIDAIHRNVRQFVRLVRAARREVARGQGDTHAGAGGAEPGSTGAVEEPVAMEKPLDRMETDAKSFEQSAAKFRKGLGKGGKRDTGTSGPGREN